MTMTNPSCVQQSRVLTALCPCIVSDLGYVQKPCQCSGQSKCQHSGSGVKLTLPATPEHQNTRALTAASEHFLFSLSLVDLFWAHHALPGCLGNEGYLVVYLLQPMTMAMFDSYIIRKSRARPIMMCQSSASSRFSTRNYLHH